MFISSDFAVSIFLFFKYCAYVSVIYDAFSHMLKETVEEPQNNKAIPEIYLESGSKVGREDISTGRAFVPWARPTRMWADIKRLET